MNDKKKINNELSKINRENPFNIPEGYFVFKCPTYRNWIMVRGFVQNTGTGDDAINYYKENFKVYPLATGPREEAKYISISFLAGNTTHPRDISYFNLIDKIVQYEPSSAFTSYELGLLKTIGIEKGKELRKKKNVEHGSFKKRIILEYVEKKST